MTPRVCPACLLELGVAADRPSEAGVETPLLGYLQVVNIIGEGPRGRVFLAEWTTPGGGVATLKRARERAAENAADAAGARALARLDHPGIATFFEGGVDNDRRRYAIGEYVPGVPITRFSERERLTPSQRVSLWLQAADAVYYAHTLGIPHLNLKPSNVLVVGGGVKILDFEAAMPLRAARTEFLAPEQTAGGVGGAHSDVFALAVVLRHLLAGSESGALDRVLEAAMAFNPEDRYPAVDRFAAEVRQASPVR